MKAYFLYIENDHLDQGGFIVFANTAQEARKQADTYDLQYERWIDIRAHRATKYDNMENLSDAELHLMQWKDGWVYVDRYDMPDPDKDSDKAFLKWYARNF